MTYRTVAWSFLTAVIVASVVACSGGSSPAAPAPAPSATIAAAQPTEAPASSSQAPAPQATITSVAGPSPTSVPATQPAATTIASQESFIIEGDTEFVAWTEQALDLLRTEAPEWYVQVDASVRTFRSVPSGSGMDVFGKVYLVGEVTAYAPGFQPAQQLVWYAGTIVHDSCHSERFDQQLVYQGKEGEIACLMDQKAALLLIDTGTYFSNYVQSLIDGADDPANAYWTTADRHW
jgi:hypothetical protein